MLRINQNRLANANEMIQINQHRLVDGIHYNQDDQLTMKTLIKERLHDNDNNYLRVLTSSQGLFTLTDFICDDD